MARRYVHGAGTDEPLVWYEGTGTTTRRWFHADERGSVIAVSDGSGNLVGSTNRYDDYGSPQGGAITGRFGYTGQAWIPEIGMYDYRARIYNPAHGGRFMQTDPIGYGGGMNLYAYVGNNPVNFSDPLGLCGKKGQADCIRSLGILLALVFATAIFATPIAARPSSGTSWCSAPGPFVRALDESVGVHVQLVSRRALPRAMRMLSRRTVVRVDPEVYRRMLRDGSEPAEGRHFYVVRGGVMAPVELSAAQLPAYAEEAAYYPHDDLAPGTVLIASVMTSENRQRPRNYPLLIASARPISRVSTLCMGGR